MLSLYLSFYAPPSSWPRCRRWLQSKGFEVAMVCSLAKRYGQVRATQVAAGPHIHQKDVMESSLQVLFWMVVWIYGFAATTDTNGFGSLGIIG